MREPMLVPSSWNAATAAIATRAAATAYSDSSSPVSSFKNFLNMIDSFYWNRRLEPSRSAGRGPQLSGEFVNPGGDVSAQQLKSGNSCQRDERCRNCVL